MLSKTLQRKTSLRGKLRNLLLATLIASPLTGFAQEHEFPTLNTVGRFLGVGFSHTGYHSRIDGRFNHHNRPASAYGSSALDFPYSPSYQPFRPARISPQPQAFTAPTNVVPTPAPEMPTTEDADESSEEIQPEELPKPVGPPPNWLKPYMTEEDKPQQYRNSDDEGRSGPAIDDSRAPRMPSDRAEGPFYLEPEDASPSDRVNGGRDDFQIQDYQRDTLEREPAPRESLGRDQMDEEELPAPPDLQPRTPGASSRAQEYSPQPAAQLPVRRFEQQVQRPSEQRIQTELLSPQPIDGSDTRSSAQPIEEDELLLKEEDLSVRRRFQRAPKTARGPDGSHVSILDRTTRPLISQQPIYRNQPAQHQPAAAHYVPAGYARNTRPHLPPQHSQPIATVPQWSSADRRPAAQPNQVVRQSVQVQSFRGMPASYRSVGNRPQQPATAHASRQPAPALQRGPNTASSDSGVVAAPSQPQLNWRRSTRANTAAAQR